MTVTFTWIEILIIIGLSGFVAIGILCFCSLISNSEEDDMSKPLVETGEIFYEITRGVKIPGISSSRPIEKVKVYKSVRSSGTIVTLIDSEGKFVTVSYQDILIKFTKVYPIISDYEVMIDFNKQLNKLLQDERN